MFKLLLLLLLLELRQLKTERENLRGINQSRQIIGARDFFGRENKLYF